MKQISIGTLAGLLLSGFLLSGCSHTDECGCEDTGGPSYPQDGTVYNPQPEYIHGHEGGTVQPGVIHGHEGGAVQPEYHHSTPPQHSYEAPQQAPATLPGASTPPKGADMK